MDNITTGYNDNPVVKTIYDPCPAGFHMPASKAFTGFTTTGGNTTARTEINAEGDWNNGWDFNNRISNPDATLYFPASGYRGVGDGSLSYVGRYGYYWSAGPDYLNYVCNLRFYSGFVYPQNLGNLSFGFSVRPVSE